MFRRRQSRIATFLTSRSFIAIALRSCAFLLVLLSAAARAQVCHFANLPIPNDDPTGIADFIEVADLEVITDLDVAIEITHGFIGSVRVLLTHLETRTTVVILENTGCGGDGIDATFDDESSAPASTCAGTAIVIGILNPVGMLSAFDGESTAGTWELRVIDDTPGSSGTLLNWCLNFTVSSRACHSVPLAIPDAPAAGVSDSLFITSTAEIIDQLSLVVDISHTLVGDLVLTLTHVTTGTSAIVLDRALCNRDDVRAMFDDDAAIAAQDACFLPVAVPFTVRPDSPLSVFSGEPLLGQWRLTISDEIPGELGTLNQWCIVNGDKGECPEVECGDCDGNGLVSILDSLTAAQHAAGLTELWGTAFANCNVTGTTEPAIGAVVDVVDALRLAQFAAGITVSLRCC